MKKEYVWTSEDYKIGFYHVHQCWGCNKWFFNTLDWAYCYTCRATRVGKDNDI